MNYLLDTQSLLWLRLNPKKLKPEQIEVLTSSEEEKFVSSISLWEISLKFSLGKLDLGGHKPDEFTGSLTSIGLKHITPSVDQWSTYHLLPPVKNHKDFFDRMIIWQAMQSGVTLLSSDAKFADYKPHSLKVI